MADLLAQLSRRPVHLALLLGALFCVSALGMPFWCDDWVQLLLIEDELGLREPVAMLTTSKHDFLGLFNAFQFFGHGPEQMRQAIAHSELPWWTSPQIRLSFWRPISSALLLLDYKLFGPNPAGFHLHSMLWYVALCGAVGGVFRRSLGGLAALAAALYAIDDVHWLPMAWIANRNALVAAVPALLGLLAHLRWREEAWRPGALLGPLGLALGLLGGEVALSVLAFFLSYELFAGRGGRGERLRALAPVSLVFLAWAAAYRLGGFGGGGSSLYVDPLRQPWQFLTLAPQRALILVGSALGGLPAEASVATPAAAPVAAGYGATCAVAAALMTRLCWGQLDPLERRGLRWLVPGALIGLVPVLATFPLDRLLLVPGMAASALVAVALRAGWRGLRGGEARVARLALLPALVHLVSPPLVCAFQRSVFANELELMDGLYARAFPDPAALPRQHVVMICASDMTIGLYLPAASLQQRRPIPASFDVLSAAQVDHRVTRTGERTLEIELVNGGLDRAFLTRLTMDLQHPFAPGDRVKLVGGEIEVLEVGKEGPNKLRFELAASPDSPEMRLEAWRDGALVPVELSVGQSLEIPWTPGPRML